MKWLFLTVYVLAVIYSAWWLIAQTESYWWVLLAVCMMPRVVSED